MKPKEPIEIMMHNHTDAVLPECSESIVLAYSAKSSQMCACFSILTNTRGYPPQASYLELYFFFLYIHMSYRYMLSISAVHIWFCNVSYMISCNN